MGVFGRIGDDGLAAVDGNFIHKLVHCMAIQVDGQVLIDRNVLSLVAVGDHGDGLTGISVVCRFLEGSVVIGAARGNTCPIINLRHGLASGHRPGVIRVYVALVILVRHRMASHAVVDVGLCAEDGGISACLFGHGDRDGRTLCVTLGQHAFYRAAADGDRAAVGVHAVVHIAAGDAGGAAGDLNAVVHGAAGDGGGTAGDSHAAVHVAAGDGGGAHGGYAVVHSTAGDDGGASSRLNAAVHDTVGDGHIAAVGVHAVVDGAAVNGYLVTGTAIRIGVNAAISSAGYSTVFDGYR